MHPTDLPTWIYRAPRRTYPAMQMLAGRMLTRCPQPSPRVLAELRHRRKPRWWAWVLSCLARWQWPWR